MRSARYSIWAPAAARSLWPSPPNGRAGAITGVDISPPALEIAAHNARDLGLSQVRWRLGTWFDPVAGERFHLIVANPPYVAAGDPGAGETAGGARLALVAGPTGLEALVAIIAQAPSAPA